MLSSRKTSPLSLLLGALLCVGCAACAATHTADDPAELFEELTVAACDCELRVTSRTECTGTSFDEECIEGRLEEATAASLECTLGLAEAILGCLNEDDCGRTIGCDPSPTALGASRRPEDVRALTDLCSAGDRELANAVFAECRR